MIGQASVRKARIEYELSKVLFCFSFTFRLSTPMRTSAPGWISDRISQSCHSIWLGSVSLVGIVYRPASVLSCISYFPHAGPIKLNDDDDGALHSDQDWGLAEFNLDLFGNTENTDSSKWKISINGAREEYLSRPIIKEDWSACVWNLWQQFEAYYVCTII